MIIKIDLNNTSYTFDSSRPLDISIPLLFNGSQPNTYNVGKAEAKAYETGDFVGDTRRGGGCNFEEHKLIPHCNGTHTEGVGHISLERISISDILKECFIPSSLITVQPEKALDTKDSYFPDKDNKDFLITKSTLEEKIKEVDKKFLEGLIIRTLPNNDSKKARQYMDEQPSFFSVEAMEYIVSLDVKHLLLDIPSVDRTFDEGKLTAHHIFWNVLFGSHDVDKKDHSMKTITEMIYAADEVEDGKYFINIQIPNFAADAAPSRVLVYEVESS